MLVMKFWTSIYEFWVLFEKILRVVKNEFLCIFFFSVIVIFGNGLMIVVVDGVNI